MNDLALTWDGDALAADLSITANDLTTDDGLRTAVLCSLFEDGRATDDALPDGVTERRGWWGDAFPVTEDDRRGSRLWLLARENPTPSVLARAEGYAREALQWLIDDRVASAIDVVAALTAPGLFSLTVTIHRPDTDPATFRFGAAWQAEESRI